MLHCVMRYSERRRPYTGYINASWLPTPEAAAWNEDLLVIEAVGVIVATMAFLDLWSDIDFKSVFHVLSFYLEFICFLEYSKILNRNPVR